MNEYDEEILHYFLEHQTQLFPEAVAESPEEAEEFLEDSKIGRASCRERV